MSLPAAPHTESEEAPARYQPTAASPPPMPTFRRLLTLAAPFAGWMLLAALLGVLTVASGVSLMALGAWLIATAALQPAISALSVAVVGVRFFGLARGVSRYLERLVSHELTFRLLARLRVWFYQGLEPLAPARLLQHRTGDLLARIAADIDTLENIYLRVVAPPLIALIVGLGLAVFFALYDVLLAAALLACLLLAGVGVPLLTHALARHTGAQRIATRAALNVTLVDGVQGMADLVAANAAARHAAQAHALNRELAAQQARMARVAGLQNALMAFLAGLAGLLTLAIATPLVREGSLDGVMLTVLVLAALSSFEAVLPLPTAFQHLGSSLAAARRLFEIVDAAPAVHDEPAARPALQPGALAALPLELRGVSFNYESERAAALRDISFAVRAGSTLAIVGASGAGKSSLVNLLLRFWEPDAGEIQLFGEDVRDLTAEAVRAQLSVVSQQTYLFSGTIADNLRLAWPDAADADLVAAARAAHLHDFVAALPHGYDTEVGEHGLALSGGERQRVAIARAILKDAPILILDEPTANLDAVTERRILDTIYTALTGRTTLLITHRLVGLQRADEILVLHAGQLVERGTHSDLLQAGGAYARLWAHQEQRLANGAVFDTDST